MTSAELALSALAFQKTWKAWTQVGMPVLVLRDVPISPGRKPTNCVAENPSGVDICTLPVEVAAPRDPIDIALTNERSPLVNSFDPSPGMCDVVRCHFVVGGLITHRDTNHLTNTFALSLEPLLATAIDRSLR